MNKEELIKQVSARTDLNQKQASECLNAIIDVISEQLVESGKITLVGFGTFQVRERAAREGRNPRTGEALKISAKRSPVWTAGKTLKERVEAGKAPKKVPATAGGKKK
ncbi:MAG: HU family DNA-binding protein [Candidatus Sericytochromatia bacterium]|nr:HU family DNA-binding protein [Candidatus Tanganyikabacteria bacterium]